MLKLTHHTNPNKVYLVVSSAVKKSKTLDQVNIVRSGNEPSLDFIIKYLNYYDEIDEAPVPEQPLPKDLPLKDIFEYEEHIFGTLLTLDDLENKGIFIKNIMEICIELKLETLLSKVSAIMCYYACF